MANPVTPQSPTPTSLQKENKDNKYDPIKVLRVFFESQADIPPFLGNYIINRLGDQIEWYDMRSSKYKKQWERFRKTIIILSACIPFLVGLIGMNFGDHPNDIFDMVLKLVVGVAGVVIAVLESLNQLYKNQTLYIDYRITAEQLKQEFSYFMGKGGKYEGLKKDESYSTLIANCESIMANENNRWAEVSRDNEQAAKSNDIQKALKEFLEKNGATFAEAETDAKKKEKKTPKPKPE